MTTESTPETKSYSPFLPLMAVFLTFTLLQAWNLYDGLRQRRHLIDAQVEAAGAVPKAQKINQLTEELGNDLLALAAGKKSPEAERIVSEFEIRPTANNAAKHQSGHAE